ncbi:MAG: hypothetical protein GEV09_12630 [Pseudonocardiaceae bacterium]|nr:hypothetical protein [Pseudonocardiaceae bacterium]
MDPKLHAMRAQLAGLTRHRGRNDPSVIELAERFEAERRADRIRELVAGWPPLSAEQADLIAALLRGPDRAGGSG